MYPVEIRSGPSIYFASTIEYKETSIIAGKLSYVDMQSRDTYSAKLVSNNNDKYILHYIGPDGTTAGEFYVLAVGQSQGYYRA